MSGLIFAVVGAESTGKTTLALEMACALRAKGLDAVVVPEYLREACEHLGRTPHQSEQHAIAAEQTRRISEAARQHAIVLADTTALMTAVYSEWVFGDKGLYCFAEGAHAQATHTLLTSLDLAWVADGMQRDGPHVREPVDALIRQALQRMGAPYAVVAGQGPARVQHGLGLVEHVLDAPQRQARAGSSPRWRWVCDKCDDGECEQHWLPRA